MKRSLAITLSCMGLMGLFLAANRHLVFAQPPEGSSAKLERPLLSPDSRPLFAPPATHRAALSPDPIATTTRSINVQAAAPSWPAAPAGLQVYGPAASRAYTIAPATALNHENEAAIRQLLGAYQATKDEAERKKLLADIQTAVTKQFEAKQEVRSKELAALEAKLKELQATHQKRESLKEKIVSDRVQQLINNIDGLGWGYEPSLGNTFVPAGALPFPNPGFQPFDATGLGTLPSPIEPGAAVKASDVYADPSSGVPVDTIAPTSAYLP